MGRLSDRMVYFLRQASAVAKLVIVTLAKRPWIHNSCENFCPNLMQTIDELEIPIVYAQENVDKEMQQEYAKDEFKSNDQMEIFWCRVKGKAIYKAVDDFYEDIGATWKNIMSIGDSDFERFGTQLAFSQWVKANMPDAVSPSTAISEMAQKWTKESTDANGHFKKCRVKTLKLLDEPTAEELLAEANLMIEWIAAAIKSDEGFDFTLESSDNDTALEVIHEKITNGEKAPEYLTWPELVE